MTAIVTIEAMMPSKRYRKIRVSFVENGTDLRRQAARVLFKRMRRPSLWDGVEFNVYPSIGQAVSGVFESSQVW